MLGTIFPRVSAESVLTVGCKESYQLGSVLFREARADADMLQVAIVVKKAEQERANSRSCAFLVPAKAGNNTIALALVLDLEHHALIRLIGSQSRLGDDAVETSALKATKPVRRHA